MQARATRTRVKEVGVVHNDGQQGIEDDVDRNAADVYTLP